MEQAYQDFNQLLHKLAITRHYLHLFETELVMVDKQPSILEHSLESIRIKDQLTKIQAACQPLNMQEDRVQTISWYNPESYRTMEASEHMVRDWLQHLSYLEQVALAQPFFYTLLDQDRSQSYGILVDLFSSLRLAKKDLNDEYLKPFKEA